VAKGLQAFQYFVLLGDRRDVEVGVAVLNVVLGTVVEDAHVFWLDAFWLDAFWLGFVWCR